MKNAIKFALWLSENMYEDMYQDRNKNGKTWASHIEEQTWDMHTEKNIYTIEELYNKYITE